METYEEILSNFHLISDHVDYNRLKNYSSLEELQHNLAITRLAEYSYWYITKIPSISDELREVLLNYIKLDTDYAFIYAADIMERRWPEAEELHKHDPEFACAYARDVIQGRWVEVEEVIIQYPAYVYYYARDVMKARWPEAEDSIKQNSVYWTMYKENFKIE